MRVHRIGMILALPLVVGLAPRADARISGGKGASDCYAEFDGVTATGTFKGKPIEQCEDGCACDADGQVNHSCTFTITTCASQTDIAGCTPQPVTKFVKNNKHLSTSELTNLTAPKCASQSTSVTVGLLRRRSKFFPKQTMVRLIANTKTGTPKKDFNLFFLKCVPSTGQCGGGTTVNAACPAAGASTCPNNATNANGPREIKLTTGATGTDLDNGVTGTSHNFPVVAGGQLRLCLKGADASKCNDSTDPECQACGATGSGSMNGLTFGAPLPLFASSVPVCVVNRWQEPFIQGTVNVKTGDFTPKVGTKDTPVLLFADVFLTNPLQVCPRCINGKCNSGQRQGQSCTVNGTVTVNNPPQAVNDVYNLSSDCPPLGEQPNGPNGGDFQATLNISLGITTGTSSLSGSKPCPGQPRDDDCGSIGSVCNTPCGNVPAGKGGINQYCCGDGKTPCFPSSTASGIGKIERTGQPDSGTPPWPDPTYPKVGTNGKLAAVFCEAKTGSPSIDTTSGLPGPGALILTGKQCLIGNNGTDCP